MDGVRLHQPRTVCCGASAVFALLRAYTQGPF